ncbi:MAG: phospholipid carrier-dependent glycosyltransferase [bacterium]|nr:phospholipid carrier-dependent glycosyltransferase [bacterium]
MNIDETGVAEHAPLPRSTDSSESISIPPSTQALVHFPPVWREREFWLLFILAALIPLISAWRPLLEPTEGRYAECAREMIVNHEWLDPTLNLEEHWTKPPLTYWAIAAGIQLFGYNEYGVRAYLILSYAVTSACAYIIAYLLWGEKNALICGLAYTTSLFTAVSSTIVSTDVFLAMWDTLAVTCFWAAVRLQSRPAMIGMWAAFGAAFLTKGPPGLLIMVGVIAAYIALQRQRQPIPSLFQPTGAALFVLIGLGWYLYEILHHPGLVSYWVFHEVYGRVFTDEFHRNEQWYYAFTVFLPVLFLGPLPWVSIVIFHPRMFIGQFQSWYRRKGWSTPEWAYLLTSIIIPTIVFMCSQSRLHLYMTPVFIPVGLAVGRVFYLLCSKRRRCLIGFTCAALMLIAVGKTVVADKEADKSLKSQSQFIIELIQKQTRPPRFYFIGRHLPYGLQFYTGEFYTLINPSTEEFEESVSSIISSNRNDGYFPVFVIERHFEPEDFEYLKEAGLRGAVLKVDYGTVNKLREDEGDHPPVDGDFLGLIIPR